MAKKSHIAEASHQLRHRAEQSAGTGHLKSAGNLSEAEVRRLVHELEVHQIELEMQNDELRIARDEAEAVLEKYTGLYDFAPVGYFTLSREGSIQLANLTGALLVGIERSKLIGRGFGMLMVAEDRVDFGTFLEQVFTAEGKHSQEFRLAGNDHLPRVVDVEAQRSPDGLECSAMVVDITGRKHAEEETRLSEVRYRRLFEAANDGVLLLDPATCRITDANPCMTELLGYPREELVGKELFEIGLLKDEEASREMFRNLKKNHEVRYEDLPLKCQGGKHQEVEVVANLYQEGGHPVIQCNIRDITARKLSEDILRRNEALFSALIEQAPMGVYVVDSQLHMQQVNPSALPVFRNVHPLIGRDLSQVMRALWPQRVADQIVGHFRHTLETGEEYQSSEFAERRRDTREEETYEWQTQRVVLPAGEYGVVCFFANTTERTRAETAQRRLDVLTASNLKLKQEIVRRKHVEEKLQGIRQQQSRLLRQSRVQQNQLRDLSHRILHAQEEERKRISRELHDVIAQTLVGINLNLAALAEGTATQSPDLKRRIASTQVSVVKAVDVVHAFAKELRPTILDDLGLLPALKNFMTGFIKDTGIRVSLKAFETIEDSSGTIRTVLYRVAQEALTNVARHAKASRAEVRIELIDDVVRMAVTDNGQGFEMAANTRGKKSNRLGLLGMRERVEMIGGKFLVESELGKKTSIQVEIPNTRPAPKKSRSKSPTGHAPQAKGTVPDS